MELDILRFIQSVHTPVLDSVAGYITMLGESAVLTLFLLVIYWAVDREKGEYIALCLLSSLFFGCALKAIFMRPRPISQPGIRSLRVETATGASFPSGHSLNAAAACGAFARLLRKPAVTVSMALLILLIGLSRLYLGVHWPSDVLAGIVMGMIIAHALYALDYHNIKDKHTAFAVVALACIICALITKQEDAVKSAGVALGAAVSTFINRRFDFDPGPSRIRLAARLILGLALVAGVFLGGKAALPDTLIFVFVRYLAVGLTAMLACPRIFVRLRL